jgi:K+-sensing histidine kinase KdpD
LADLKRFVRTSVRGDKAAGIRCIVAVGAAGAVVLAHARRARPGIIVMGTHGRRGFRKLFFGSTTEAVLRRFRGPVLAIPPRCREPRRAWPGGYIVAAVEDSAHRRALLSAAARMAEAFGAWLAVAPVVADSARAGRRDAQMVILPLPQAAHLRMLRQGGSAYRFVCGARRPVLVMRTGHRTGVIQPSRAA